MLNLDKTTLPSALLNNRYRVLSVLGDGGFGKIFLAEDTQMPSARKCVVKQLKPDSDNAEVHRIVQERFQREAAILEKLGENHEQIPRLYANFVEANHFYLVEEWIDGETLTQKVQREGVLGEKAVREILCGLLPAIAYVHQQQIVHRDIKPDNIIIRGCDRKPVLIDFGAVKESMTIVAQNSNHSSHSIVVGTPGYMPSEQLAGRPVYASDLYSLGLTAIYLLTGKHPQELESDPRTGEICWQHYAPNTSPGFAAVLNRTIHMNAQSRFTTAEEMLTAVLTLVSSGALPSGPLQPATILSVTQPNSGSPIAQPAVPEHFSNPNPSQTVVLSIPSQETTHSSQSSKAQSSKLKVWHWALLGTLCGSGVVAISTPSFLNQAAQARQSEAVTHLGAIGRAQKQYFVDHQTFEPTLEKLGTGIDLDGENYKYNQYQLNDVQVITTAASKQRGSRSYATITFLTQKADGSLSPNFAICQTIEPSKVAPQEIQLLESAVLCPSGSELKDDFTPDGKILLEPVADQASGNVAVSSSPSVSSVTTPNSVPSTNPIPSNNLVSSAHPVPSANQYSQPVAAALTQEQAIGLVNQWLAAKPNIFGPPFNRELLESLATGKCYQDNLGSINWLQGNGYYYTYATSRIENVWSFVTSNTQPFIKVNVYEDLTLHGPNGIDRSKSGARARNFVYYFAQDANGQWKIANYQKTE